MTEDQLYQWCESVFMGSGDTEFPTVREAAKHFKCLQREVIETAECTDRFIVNIAIGIAGVGHRRLPQGEWTLETVEEA